MEEAAQQQAQKDKGIDEQRDQTILEWFYANHFE